MVTLANTFPSQPTRVYAFLFMTELKSVLWRALGVSFQVGVLALLTQLPRREQFRAGTCPVFVTWRAGLGTCSYSVRMTSISKHSNTVYICSA